MFFFFKQKTAYDMRISDWSSDVCSSDLQPDGLRAPAPAHYCAVLATMLDACAGCQSGRAQMPGDDRGDGFVTAAGTACGQQGRVRSIPRRRARWRARQGLGLGLYSSSRSRSEEHTSELQSLMRISYSAF